MLDEIHDYDQHCGVHEGTMESTPERDSDNQLESVALGLMHLLAGSILKKTAIFLAWAVTKC